jgi:hypothetical protein
MLGNSVLNTANLFSPPYISPEAIYIRVSLGKPRALRTNVVSPGVRGQNPSSLFFSESISFSFHQGYAYLRSKRQASTRIEGKGREEKVKLIMKQQHHKYLILVNSSVSSSEHPCVQPEKASISISYLR